MAASHETFAGFRLAVRLVLGTLLERAYSDDPEGLAEQVKLIEGAMDKIAISDVAGVSGEMVKHHALDEIETLAESAKEAIEARLHRGA